MRAITSLYEEEWGDEQDIVIDDVLSLTMAVSGAIPPAAWRGFNPLF